MAARIKIPRMIKAARVCLRKAVAVYSNTATTRISIRSARPIFVNGVSMAISQILEKSRRPRFQGALCTGSNPLCRIMNDEKQGHLRDGGAGKQSGRQCTTFKTTCRMNRFYQGKSYTYDKPLQFSDP